MSLSVLAIAAALQAAVPPPPDIRTHARARQNLASYVRDGDYPAEAFANDEQGTTHFQLTVDRNGRVTDCVVTRSSGSPSIDAATCRIMLQRARFTPAVGLDGSPVEDQVRSSIGWRLN